jgi:hypothetical protein
MVELDPRNKQLFCLPSDGPNVIIAPRDTSWKEGSGVAMSDEALESLMTRYGSDVHLHRLILRGVCWGVALVNDGRDQQENAAIEKVKETLCTGKQNTETFNEFLRAHAGRIENPLDFILMLANLTIEHPDLCRNPLGFYVFGESQGGLWNTPSSDIKLKTLRQDLEGRRVLANPFERKDPGLISYLYKPCKPGAGTEENITRGESLGLIRRRRPVGDVALNDKNETTGHVVKLFKESNGLVVHKYLNDEAYEAVAQSLATTADASRERALKVASRLVGEAFERAITEEKGKTPDIVPLTTNIVAMIGHGIK